MGLNTSKDNYIQKTTQAEETDDMEFSNKEKRKSSPVQSLKQKTLQKYDVNNSSNDKAKIYMKYIWAHF